ncbi:C-type lectin (CTL) or carbohydrate-recognition domain (CRD) [Mactra antiquata]
MVVVYGRRSMYKMFLNYVFWLLSVSLLIVTEATDCPNLWIAYNGVCYRFTEMSMTFVDAEHYCEQHHGHLVHIESAEENSFVKQEISQLIATHWWIGLSDDDIEGKFVWYGTSKVPEYTDWFPGNPSNSAGKEDCGEIIRDATYGTHWNDVDCHNVQPAVCEQPGGSTEVIG